MTQSIELRLEGDPVPKGRPRFVMKGKFVQAYTPKKTREAEKRWAKLFERDMPTWFPAAVEEKLPIKVDVIFGMPIPKSLSQKKRVAMLDTPHVKRPDLDNLVKLVLDGLGVHFEDSLVSDIKAKKVYAPSSFTEIRLFL